MSGLPRVPLWGGRIEAHGIWIDRGALGEAVSRARVISALSISARVFDVAEGYLVLWASARVVDVDEAEGVLVVQDEHGVYASGPFRERERAELDARAGQWLHVFGGQIHVVDVPSCPVLDVATWIDVSSWNMSSADTLGLLPETVSPTVVQLDEDRAQTVHEMMGEAAPEVAPERDALLDALNSVGLKSAEVPKAGSRLFEMLSRWFGDGGSTAGYPMLEGERTLGASTPPEPGLLSKLWRRFVTRSPLSALIGRRQAEYLERTMQMFEDGDIDEALRHAIPFSSLPGAPSPPSISVPSPRASLDLSATPKPAASGSLNLGGETYQRLKDLYRHAVERLEKLGRIEEAAYVFFELLGEPDNGVALLERHDRYALAATMAQGHGREPGLVIRLWFLAGEPLKGVLVAIRTGAFADAVGRLESSHPEHAERLRLIWADRLARSGDYVAAVHAIWPAKVARHIAKGWVDRAIAMGGMAGASMLARKVSLWPDDENVLQEVQTSLGELVARSKDDGGHQQRLQFAQSWVDAFDRDPPAIALEPLVRQMMLDGPQRATASVTEQLRRHSLDPLFAVDLGWATRPQSPEVEQGEVHGEVFEAQERGLASIIDAVLLPQGGFVVALGEAGILVLDARGRIKRRYREPASTLVLSDSGLRLITLHQRGETQTIARVDLESGRHQRWADVALETWARSYDGSLWFVATRDAVMAIDAQAERFDAVWRVGGMSGYVADVNRDPENLWFASIEERSSWIWHYELSTRGPTLRLKKDGPSDVSRLALGAGGVPLGWRANDESRCEIVSPAEGRRESISAPCWLRVSHDVAYSVRDDVGATVFLVSHALQAIGKVVLRGTSRVHAHVDGRGFLLLADSLGRLIVLNRDRQIVEFVTVDA